MDKERKKDLHADMGIRCKAVTSDEMCCFIRGTGWQEEEQTKKMNKRKNKCKIKI